MVLLFLGGFSFRCFYRFVRRFLDSFEMFLGGF